MSTGFEPVGQARKLPDPSFTVYKRGGTGRFNKAAAEQWLSDVEYIQWSYNANTDQIGIRPTDDPSGYSVGKSGGYTVSVIQPLRAAGIEYERLTESVRLTINERIDGLLTVDVSPLRERVEQDTGQSVDHSKNSDSGRSVDVSEESGEGEATEEIRDDLENEKSDQERVLDALEVNDGQMRQQEVYEYLDRSYPHTREILADMATYDTIEKHRSGRENIITLPGVDPFESDEDDEQEEKEEEIDEDERIESRSVDLTQVDMTRVRSLLPDSRGVMDVIRLCHESESVREVAHGMGVPHSDTFDLLDELGLNDLVGEGGESA